ncbi:MAG: hypothetical protein HYU67_11485 [Flavobacteriia bacterium]|nr:hypothetical protein [Flavobacteriia bacterium]
MKFFLLSFYTFFFILVEAQFSEVNKAWSYFEKGNHEQAEKTMQMIGDKSISMFNKYEKTFYYVNYAKILIENKKYSDALDKLITAKELNVNDSIKYQQIYNSAFGELFQSIGAYSTAIEYKKKVFNQTKDEFTKFLAANSVGSMFYQINQLDSALFYFTLQSKSSSKIKNKLYYASSINNIGLAYFQKKMFEKALNNFYEAKKIMNNNIKDLDFYFSLEENIGRCLFELKQFKKAILSLKLVHENDLKTKKYLTKAFYQNLIVSIYLRINEIKKAKEIEKSIEKSFKLMNNSSKYYFLSLQHEIALYENKFEKAKYVFEKIKEIQNKIEIDKKIALNSSNVIVAKFLVSEAKIRLTIEQKEKENSLKKLDLEKKENYFIKIAFITFLILFIIVLYVLYQYLKNKQKKAILEKEFLLLEEEKLKLKIGQQEKNLTEFAIDFSKKKEMDLEIVSQLIYLSSIKESEIKQEIKKLLSELKIKQSLDKRVEDLNQNSELILINFKNKLIQLHPTLTKTEIELCSLIKLNLSNKEIAEYRNITDDSVKIFKNRLKRKLNLNSTVVLSEYLSAIN